MSKILLSGLPGAGKSSIYKETYEKIVTASDNTYKNEIMKIKSLEKVLQIHFLEEEGDQLDFLAEKQIKDLFSNVTVSIWVVDISNQRTSSTSLFHWKTFQKSLIKYSPFSLRFICFHKTDLLEGDNHKNYFKSLKKDYESESDKNDSFYYTSSNDSSVFIFMATVLQKVREASFEISQAENKIHQFLQTNDDFYGVVLISSDGLPVIEMGERERIEYVTLPANLWLSTNDRLKEAFQMNQLTCTIHLDEQTLLFFDIEADLLLTCVAKKEAPIQFSFIRSDLLAQSLNEIFRKD
jgi:predicted regulator of Ras-like GTPase activity (Roadblock/LC7/MglB family)